jgi:hypothetical protein
LPIGDVDLALILLTFVKHQASSVFSFYCLRIAAYLTNLSLELVAALVSQLFSGFLLYLTTSQSPLLRLEIFTADSLVPAGCFLFS